MNSFVAFVSLISVPFIYGSITNSVKLSSFPGDEGSTKTKKENVSVRL